MRRWASLVVPRALSLVVPRALSLVVPRAPAAAWFGVPFNKGLGFSRSCGSF